MPSTAILLRADGTDRVHAHRPDEEATLCGLDVVSSEDYDQVPPRSADYTGVRYYAGHSRLMCGRCLTHAVRIRVEIVDSGEVRSVPLQEVR